MLSMPSVAYKNPRPWLIKVIVVILFAQWLAGPVIAARADDPQPDPAGIATGDKTSTSDAGGNSFMLTEPTDKTAPDYAKTLKAFQDFQDQAAKEPLAIKLADNVGHLRIATNFTWTLLTGYLVLFMQAGFALLTCGLVRKKNAGHLMMLNLAAYVFSFLAYWACGFAFQYGGAAINAAPTNLGGTPTLNHFLLGGGLWGLLGGKGFFLSGPGYDAGSLCLTRERITFWSFILAEIFMGGLLYPTFGCWVWGGGWLSQLGNTMNLAHGYVDFAGSTVVHGVGGSCAMALAVILGPRIGKYGPDGKPRAFPAHNLAYVVTGTFILVFGWMGFNPGSTLGSTDLRISVIAVNTNLAAVAGSASAMFLWYYLFGKPDITMACNGMLAGLVAITAPCAFVSPSAAVMIGILAGILVDIGVLFNERVIKVDDPCGAISVHGYCGWLGAVCVGIFADGTYGAGWNGVGATTYLGKAGQGVTGILYGDYRQFFTQVGGATFMAVYIFGFTYVAFSLINAIKPIRVSKEAELEGLDVPQFGLPAYPEDEVVDAEPQGAMVRA